MKKIEMMKKVGLLALMSVFLFSGTLFAQESKNYISARVGYLMPGDSDPNWADFDSVFNFGASYGHFVSDNFSFEIGIEQYSLESDVSTNSGLWYTDDHSIIHIKRDTEINVMAIPLTGKYHFPVNNNFNAYIGAGIGLYFNDIDQNIVATANNHNDRKIDSPSDSGSCFGFHALAGADYQLSPNFSIGAEVKWSVANQTVTNIELNDEGERRSNDEDVNVGGINLNAVVKYLF